MALGEHIPGNPTILPINKAGAGSNVLAAYIYGVAPKDGTELAIVFPGAVLDPLLGTQAVQDDPSKFIYLGSANVEDFLCFVRSDAPVKTYEEAMKTQVLMAASAAGGSTVDMPALANNLLGTKFRVVNGYPGSREINLAIEQGEVQGACGIGWSSIELQNPDSATHGEIEILSRRRPQLAGARRDGRAHELQLRQDRRRPPNPATRLQPGSLRPSVHSAAGRDRRPRRGAPDGVHGNPRRPASARRSQEKSLDVAPLSGEEVQALVSKVYSMPPNIVARAKAALRYKAP